MSSKKHLDNQARRRTDRRRAIHLSEFLRGDGEPTVQVPASQTDSQNANQSSIGTIPATIRSTTFVSVSPVVTPVTPEKIPPPPPSPPATPTPVNVWQSSCENDSPRDSFMPDHEAFPDLGKPVKKVKTLGTTEANIAARAPDSSKARRCCHVLGNFLPESLIPEGAAGKGQAVASCLTDVHSTVVNCQGTKPPSGSPPGITILKRTTSQQPETPGCASVEKITVHSEITLPASTAVVAAVTAPALERGPSQQKSPNSSPEKKSTSPACSSKQKNQMQSEINLHEPSTSAVAAPAVRSMEWGPSKQKEHQAPRQKSPESSSEKKPKSPDCSQQRKTIQREISPREPASTSAVAAPAVQSMEWGPSKQKEHQTPTQTSPERSSEKSESPASSSMQKNSMQPEICPQKPTFTAPAVQSMKWRPSQDKQLPESPKSSPEKKTNNPGCSSVKKMPLQPEIGPHEPASTSSEATFAGQSMEWGPSQQKEHHNQTQKSPVSFSEKKSNSSACSQQKMLTKPEISSREAASTSAVAAPAVQSMKWRPSQEMQPRESPKSSPEKKTNSPGCSSVKKMPLQPEISPHEPASTSAVATFAVQSMEWGPSQEKPPEKNPESASGSAGLSKQMFENPSALDKKQLIGFEAGEEYVVLAPQQDQRQSLRGNPIWEESDGSSQEEETVKKTGKLETTFGSLNPIHRSLLNANAEEFHPMVRERRREQEPARQLHESRLTRRRRAQRFNRSMYRWQRNQTTSGPIFEYQVPAQGQPSQLRAIQLQREGQRQGELQRQVTRQRQGEVHRRGIGQRLGNAQRQGEVQRLSVEHRRDTSQRHGTGQRHSTGQRYLLGQQHSGGQRQSARYHYHHSAGYRLGFGQRQGGGQQQEQNQIALYARYYSASTGYRRQQQQQQLQQQQAARAEAQRQLYQGNQMYPVYVAAPPVPTAYGPPPPPPVYLVTPVYAAPSAPSPATVDYVATSATIDYVATVDYVAAPAPSNPYGGYVSYPVMSESLVCPFIWAMQ